MARPLLLLAVLAAAGLSGCLHDRDAGPPAGPPDLVLADAVEVRNGTHVLVPLAANASGTWEVQVRVIMGAPITFWLATPAQAATFGNASFEAMDRLPVNIEGRLRGSVPDGRAVLVLDNTGRGPPAWAPGGGVVVSYRALFHAA